MFDTRTGVTGRNFNYLPLPGFIEWEGWLARGGKVHVGGHSMWSRLRFRRRFRPWFSVLTKVEQLCHFRRSTGINRKVHRLNFTYARKHHCRGFKGCHWKARYLPGDKLNEVEVAAQYDVSRNTLREAFATLAAEQLLVRIPNRGVFIATPDVEYIMDLYRARAIIKPAGAYGVNPWMSTTCFR